MTECCFYLCTYAI